MEFRSIVKKMLLNESELFLLAAAKLQFNTDEAISNYIYKNMRMSHYIESETKFCLHDVTIIVDGFHLVWFESLLMDTEIGQLSIGHFALDSKLVGCGLGKKILLSLRGRLQKEFGITQILFNERAIKPYHPKFFVEKIGAKEVKSFPAGRGWLWVFDECV
jgi:hypothetical protein